MKREVGPLLDVNNFEFMKIGLASPDKIRSWSFGEVKKPETINYRTLKPEKDGLFCERIFGPTKDWECHCGKYKRVRYKGVVCDRCGVEVTRAKVRRERMGHIELAAPVSHIWYFKGIPSRMGLVLDMSPRALEEIIYFASYVVTDPGDSTLEKKQLLSEKEYRAYREKYGNKFQASMGAEAIKKLLLDIDLIKEAELLKEELKTAQGQRRTRAIKRLEVVEAFRRSGNRPEWMILSVLPVIPPDLRPMVQLDGGRFATSDLNDLYRRVINRNNRLKRLLELGAPEIIIRNEKRMLQEACDALIDNGRRGRSIVGTGNHRLKSLSDMLKGKQGRFRQNLLGKRVDYSGRSVIVVGPELKLHQCGLPKKMALELFKPFVMRQLVDKGIAHNIKSAKRIVERASSRPEVWDVVEEVIQDHPVLLTRAPTLPRLGIQAFMPVLVEGSAIQIHPMVCFAFNADFDGDQMAVHVPLSRAAQEEAKRMMLSTANLLSPAAGEPVVAPTQDMVLGCYYLTIERETTQGKKPLAKFGDETEALLAYDVGRIDTRQDAELENHSVPRLGLHSPIEVTVQRWDADKDESVVEPIRTTVGRVIFNQALPERLRFVNKPMNRTALRELVSECYRVLGPNETAHLVDGIKSIGFHYATRGGMTIAVDDITVPTEKQDLLKAADQQVEAIDKQFQRGLITDDERYESVVTVWKDTTQQVSDRMMEALDPTGAVTMMTASGARGNKGNIGQLGGMRGLMADPTGRIIDVPVRSNFREGMTVLEYFISTHGARKGLADTALRTADSGYLTRRLVDVAQDVITCADDCGTEEGTWITRGETEEYAAEADAFQRRVVGRYAAGPVIDPKARKKGAEPIVGRNEEITEEIANRIVAAGVEEVLVRSPLTCQLHHGVCRLCYGRNLATGSLVGIGEAVGIIAAQSIGEPGTQLTMRTFHTGGVAGLDITAGLPRVEELFEARMPKGKAEISHIDGVVEIIQTESGGRRVKVTSREAFDTPLRISKGHELLVAEGDTVEANQVIARQTGDDGKPVDEVRAPERGLVIREDDGL